MPASFASAPTPVAPSSSRRDRTTALTHRMLHERCRYQASQILYEPLFGAALIGLLGTTLIDRVPALTLGGWAAMFALVLAIRLWAAAGLLHDRLCRDASGHAALFRLSAGLTGLLLGASASLFFPHLEHAGRMMLTLALAVWLAASLPLHAAFPRHARLHIGLILFQLALAWWLFDPQSGWLWALSLAACAVCLDRLSAGLGRTLAHAQAGRHQRRELLRRLALESEHARRASATASRFLAAASHDLRQPATALSLMSKLLEQRCEDQTLRPLVQAITRSSTALNDLLGNLLDLSRLDAGVVRPDRSWIGVDAMISDLQAEFEWRLRDKGLEFVVSSCGGMVFTDRVLLMRMLRNLLENALRYTAAGRVALAAQSVDGVRFVVSDTGIGISEAHRAVLFSDAPDPLIANHRARSKGLGIGLSMVSRIAELIEASLGVDSDGRSWSRFMVGLAARDWRPLDDQGSERAGEPPGLLAKTQHFAEDARARIDPVGYAMASAVRSDAQAPLAPAHALLVEDSPEVTLAVRGLLEARGYRVECRDNASDALRVLRGPIRFDLILSDYHLPGQLDGIDLLTRARQLQPDARCILTTADTTSTPQARARAADVELLRKPLQPDLLG
jgi:signal transduction histidine kinase